MNAKAQLNAANSTVFASVLNWTKFIATVIQVDVNGIPTIVTAIQIVLSTRRKAQNTPMEILWTVGMRLWTAGEAKRANVKIKRVYLPLLVRN